MLRKGSKPVSITHPHLMEEWGFEKNGEIRPEDFSAGSHQRVVWVCSVCAYSWCAEIRVRALRKYHCPACSGRVAFGENTLYHKHKYLLKEWDYEKNELTPFDVTPCSGEKVWWLCDVCANSWRATISHRVYGTGCPCCSGHKPSNINSVLFNYPELAKEWDYDKNEYGPDKYTSKSGEEVWWLCKDGHSWKSIIKNRTRNGNGCPTCSGQVLTEHNNLLAKDPKLCEEWDYHKNELTPEEVFEFSTERAWWLCKECGYSWNTVIYSRSMGRGCPKCPGGPVSVISQEWLDQEGVSKESREILIKDLGFRVDGFDPKANTVYEFFGDYWHGNLNVYQRENINPHTKKSFEALNKETMSRVSRLEGAGYKVVYIWESDFINNYK